MKSYNEVHEIVKTRLSANRLYHSECVAARCVELASIYGVDIEAARLAGIAHDIAKEMSDSDKIKYCMENNLEITLKDNKCNFRTYKVTINTNKINRTAIFFFIFSLP